MNVKIIGAGSIGCHLAQAARRMNWNVTVVDNNEIALERMQRDIYPQRYGKWDNEIQLFHSPKSPSGGFDIIAIGTPPDTRLEIVKDVILEEPRLLHLEKPLCRPLSIEISKLEKIIKKSTKTIVTVGYDHAIAQSIERVVELIETKIIGDVLSIDVEFREHWQGIFAAHPWLSGPKDSYLGYWQRGGGAGNEHSHALHLWIYLAKVSGWMKISSVKSMLSLCDHRNFDGTYYDNVASFLIKTNDQKTGRVIQDVITHPVRKWVRLQGSKGYIEWICNGHIDGDVIMYQIFNSNTKTKSIVKKTRPDDFHQLMLHYDKILRSQIKPKDSPLIFNTGLAVMQILYKAYTSI